VDQIRQSLKRQICLDYADEKMTLRVLTLEPKLEKRFSDRAHSLSGSAPSDDWAEIISSAAKGMEESGFPPVVLCSPKARSLVKEATRKKFPKLAVLSYVEIPSDISVEPLGEIRLEGCVRIPAMLLGLQGEGFPSV
jgi:flagellar biosynthesis protein FlhA